MIERATVDVSVALKWALDDEDGLTEALALRDEMVVIPAVELSRAGM